MGRNPEPVKLILSKGKSHHLTKEMIEQRTSQEVPVLNDDIHPPDFLTTKKDLQKFEFIAQNLNAIGIMSNLDADVIGRYINSEKDWLRYSKLVDSAMTNLKIALENDELEKVEKYTLLLKEYESMKAKAFSRCQECASHLGLTISSRCKLVLPPKNEAPKENKFGKFKKEGAGS